MEPMLMATLSVIAIVLVIFGLVGSKTEGDGPCVLAGAAMLACLLCSWNAADASWRAEAVLKGHAEYVMSVNDKGEAVTTWQWKKIETQEKK